MMNKIFRPAAFSFTLPITLSMAMFGTLCAASTTDDPVAPRLANAAVAAHLEGVHR